MKKTKIGAGIYWLEIPEADLYIQCGCPADSVKHLRKKGLLRQEMVEGVASERGPNAILLSDTFLQNGDFSNLAEFPVLQMLYKQGMILPNHPNNTGRKPLLLGTAEQLKAQSEYIYLGNYGLTTVRELIAAGLPSDEAELLNLIKRYFAFDHVRKTNELVEFVTLGSEFVEVRNGVFVRRVGLNCYEFRYGDQSVQIDLNLPPGHRLGPPFDLPQCELPREEFAIVHIGEGNGWDVRRPCMASIIVYKGRIYLIDAGPGILHSLKALGISINDVTGIFHTHAHDDHFAGFTDLIRADHRIFYYAAPVVRASVMKKLAALTGGMEAQLHHYMEIYDLKLGEWNDLDGLEVKPILSPHPVETTVFFFRVNAGGEYKMYAHLADIPSFSIFRNLLQSLPFNSKLKEAFWQRTIDAFLTPAHVKKVDIGGGLIHGAAADFREDQSQTLYLSHIDRELTPEEEAIGSVASFGQVDVLIPAKTDYLLTFARHYLEQYFSEVPAREIDQLLTAPVETFSPGTILLKQNDPVQRVLFVLSGLVAYEENGKPSNNLFSANTVIGELPVLQNRRSNRTYRALSSVSAFAFPAEDYRRFVRRHNLDEMLLEFHRNRHFLQRSWLFGDMISFPVQDQIARAIRWKHLNRNALFRPERVPALYLLDFGSCRINYKDGHTSVIRDGEFFGEASILGKAEEIDTVWAKTNTRLAIIAGDQLHHIPVLRWKLIEAYEKKQKKNR